MVDQRDEDKESEIEYGGLETNMKRENEKEKENEHKMKVSIEEWKGMKVLMK